jgi:pimeloyl-ACP methyl ester carboxylesterase
MQYIWRQLSAALRINILGYDYSGYGESSGGPSIRNCLADCEACYDFLVEEKGIPEEQIVLYGQSLGTGPTSELASRKPRVGGVVLHSPLASGVRVLSPKLRWWPIWCDIFPNFKLVEKIQAPTLIMHGDEDEVIDISHARLLHKNSANPYPPLFAKGYTHQNLEQCPDFLPTLHTFLRKVESRIGQPDPRTIDRAGTI